MKEILQELIKNNAPEMKWVQLMHRLGNLRLSEVPKANFDLSITQIEMLSFIGHNPGCHLQDISDELNLTPPTISVSIRKLEDDHWILRENDPKDGRASCIYLTSKSKKALQTAIEYQIAIIKKFLEELTKQEQEILLSLLKKAVDGMASHQDVTSQIPE